MWETLGAVLLGVALSWAAARHLSDRLPSRRVVFTTGTVGALFGAYVTHAALGAGVLATLLGAVAIGAVLLSLLIRPSARRLSRPLPF